MPPANSDHEARADLGKGRDHVLGDGGSRNPAVHAGRE